MAPIAQRTINGSDELATLVGEAVGISDWFDVTQEAIDTFAESTGDHHWVHTDPKRAAQSPAGSTIAHGLLTRWDRASPMRSSPSGASRLCSTTATRRCASRRHYPWDRAYGCAQRWRTSSGSKEAARARSVQIFVREGHEKPVCVAEHVIRFFD
jgi:hypothetical protein